MKQLQTPRLLLRPFTEADAPAFYDYARDPRVGLSAGWHPHRDVEESRRIIRTVMSGPHIFAVCERQTGMLVGSVGFTARTLGQGPSDEIGYSFRPDRWGRGYATEAVQALVAYGFRETIFQTIWAARYDGNEASRRVLEKNGFVRVLAQKLTDEFGEHWVHFYILTKEMWLGGKCL